MHADVKRMALKRPFSTDRPFRDNKRAANQIVTRIMFECDVVSERDAEEVEMKNTAECEKAELKIKEMEKTRPEKLQEKETEMAAIKAHLNEIFVFEKLRKKHDMLSMSLEDSDKERKKLEDTLAALNKALCAEKERAQNAAQEADAKAKAEAKLAEDQIKQAHQLTEEARRTALAEQDKLRKEVGDLFSKLQTAEQAAKVAAAKLQEELIKGADKLKAQLADKDAVIASRDKKIADLEKAAKNSQKGASEQVAELKKALADEDKEMKAAVADKDKEVKTAEAAAKKLKKEVEALTGAADKTAAELAKAKKSRDELSEELKRAQEAAGDLGEKLKEKEAELKTVKDEMAAMKKDLEGQLAAATSSSKSSSDALKRELYTVTEEKDKLKARLQQMEKEMADSTVNASKEVKRLKEELDGMIKKKLEVEKELDQKPTHQVQKHYF